MRIAVLAPSNPKDKRALSTSLYYMGAALEKHCVHVYYCDPVISLEKRLGRLVDHLSTRLFNKHVAYDHLLFVAKRHGKLATKRLAGKSFDAIVSIWNPIDIAFLETGIPVALVLDSTFSLQHAYYPQFSNLWQWSTHQANEVEQMAYRNATALLYSSSWAARSAIESYGIDPSKVHTVYFGANLDTIPPREIVLHKKKSEPCRILFIGAGWQSWQRKGGEIAVETLSRLEDMGIRAELTICGTTPPEPFVHERITTIPFLDKNDASQSKKLMHLYMRSHFLLLPTRADCTPFVFNEANAFGIPVITTATGGVPDVIRNGENGYVLPYNARGPEYARIIADIYQDDQRYAALVASSRAAYDTRMNWDVWASAVKQILQDIIDRPTVNRGGPT